MFARTSIASANLSHAKNDEAKAKSDEELIREIEAEAKNAEDMDAKEEAEYMEQFSSSALLRLWGRVCSASRSIVAGKYEAGFNILLMIGIALAAVLVGLETYPQYSGADWADGLDAFVVAIFCSEIVLKIFAEGTKPHNFFVGPAGSWNTFDFIVVLFSMPKISDVFGNSSPTIRVVSRLFRLLRVGKIIHLFPALQVIVRGLVGGIKSIAYVALLLLIVFYLYGTFGVAMFSQNDPFFFRDVSTSLITLFRVCTLEGWSDVMYINIYGCEAYTAGIYESLGSVTPINVTQADGTTTLDKWGGLNYMYRCENPTPQPELAGAYFVSFTLISSLVMLSLFIGVITMSMQESLNEMRAESAEVSRKKTLAKQLNDMKALAKRQAALAVSKTLIKGSKQAHHQQQQNDQTDNDDSSDSDDSDDDDDYDDTVIDRKNKIKGKGKDKSKGKGKGKLIHRIRASCSRWLNYFTGQRKNKDGTIVRYMTHKEKKKLRDMAEMKSLLMQAWVGTIVSKAYHHDLDIAQEGTIDYYIRWAGVYARSGM